MTCNHIIFGSGAMQMPAGDAILWSLIGIICGCLIGWAMATYDDSPSEEEDDER